MNAYVDNYDDDYDDDYDDVNDDNDDNGFETTPPRRKRELIYEIFLCDSPVQFFSGGICFWAPLNL